MEIAENNMGKKLAIKGHPTRGKEVIELLEMMGGINSNEAYGNLPNNWDVSYYIFKDGIISVSEDKILIKKQFEIFTLEEFLEKYPFKVGDKVTDLKSDKIAEVYKMYWSENNSCIYYDIKYPNNRGCQRRLMDLKPMDDTDDVHSISECKTIGQGTYAIRIANGYKFDSIDENGNIIVKSFKPKPIYPKTYEECCKVLDFCGDYFLTTYEADCIVKKEVYGILQQVSSLTQLWICKSAYWKIAGEQMRLGKPWEPEYDCNDTKYIISTFRNTIYKDISVIFNYILIFPTEEMRDAFYENFKDLIEQCKELL